MPAKKKKISVRTSLKSARRPSIGTRKLRAVTQKKKSVPRVSIAEKGVHLGMHLLIASSAVAVLLLLGIIDRGHFSTILSRAQESLPVTITLEHTRPLKMSMIVARKPSAGYIEVSNDSDTAMHISLPAPWKRTEVTGVAMDEVTKDFPKLNSARWLLPPHAGMKMLLPSAPDAILFENDASTTAAVNLQTVDLATLETTKRVVLLQTQALVTLWTTEEEE